MRIVSGPICALRDKLRSRARMIWTNRTVSYGASRQAATKADYFRRLQHKSHTGALRQAVCLRFQGVCIVRLYLFSKNITISRKKW